MAKTSARLLCIKCRNVSFSAGIHNITTLWLTFVLWSELFHLRRQGFIEALLSYDQRLTHRVVIIAHHTRVTAHLQAKWTRKNLHYAKMKRKICWKNFQHTWWMKGSSGTPPARGRSVAPPADPVPCNLLSMLLVWGRHMAPGRRTGPPPAEEGKYASSLDWTGEASMWLLPGWWLTSISTQELLSMFHQHTDIYTCV